MSVKPPSDRVEVDGTTERTDIGNDRGIRNRDQHRTPMTATPPSRSVAERNVALRPDPTNGVRPPQPVSFELSGALRSGLIVYPPDRGRPFWRDDHGHRYVLDQVLAGEPGTQREPMLRSHAQAISEVAWALACARMQEQHSQVRALAHAASRLCQEIAAGVAPDYWQPGR